ncbi:MAG: endonuclease MutS2 [Calditrichaeota bacterium]|nr:endonuclease MutS2 [Calditrichota bacterium]
MKMLNPLSHEFLKQLNQDITSLQQLEFPKLLEKLAELLATPFGIGKLSELNFSRKRPEVENALAEVQEMLGLIEAGHHIPLSGYSDFRPHLDKTRPQDAFLEPEALLEIQSNLQLMGALGGFFNTQQENAPLLNRYAQGIHYHRKLANEIEGMIDRNGEIFDNASPELRQIRIKIRSLGAEQTRALKKVQQRYSEFSQDDIITLRDGRLVLGILPSFVNKVNGIVHGTSSTGATVFVEPMETLKISNEIQNLRIKERTEIIKVLRHLTGLVREVREDIFYGLENVAYLDLIYAKARLAKAIDAHAPVISEKPYIRIDQGRHPLLVLKQGRENVVPLSLRLGEPTHTILITGPNAGGKTVSMKTVGLLLLMTQMGMLIPADPESEIPLLENILVDIGDRQSLEQDLSTFSAHVVRLREVVEQAGPNSLVLLDEAGTGTDPREGAALAIAILNVLNERQVLTIATTHHGELKAYAHRQPGVENASMEFDLETLQPTYRLRLGVPGSSYAIEIARRYGLPETLIGAAKAYIGEEKDRLEDLILEMEQRLQRYEKDSSQLSIKLSEAEAMRSLYQRQMEQMKQQRNELKRQAVEEAQQIIKDANALIERTVREIRESSAARDTIKSAKDAVRRQKSSLEKMRPKTKTRPSPAQSAELNPGDIVWVESLNEEGELLDAPNGSKKVRVLIGNVTMTLEVSGLRKSGKASLEAPVAKNVSGAEVDRAGSVAVGPELDLRGLDAEQAIAETDRYLNQVWESDWEEVRIVHGKGTGVLRQRINQYLAKDRRVAEKRLGKWGEGDTGVTVVRLSKKE